jgi:hypothetical protein
MYLYISHQIFCVFLLFFHQCHLSIGFFYSSKDKEKKKQADILYLFISFYKDIKKKTMNNIPQSNNLSSGVPRPTMARTMSMPNTPISPLTNNPWYRQKFEFVMLKIIFFLFNNIFLLYSFEMQLKKKSEMNILIYQKHTN